MPSKMEFMVRLDECLVRELSRVSRKNGKPRGRLVEEALQLWRRKRLEEELKEGYLRMAKEDRATAESHLAAGREVMG